MKFFMNQIGYLPDAPKQILMEDADFIHFQVIDDASGVCCYEGDCQTFEGDALSGIAHGRIADFSSLTTNGSYHLSVTDTESHTNCSHSFLIAADCYRPLTDDLQKMLYFQRCGCGLPARYAGIFTHEACHTRPAHLYTDPSVLLEVSGGWHDAGDYGRYITPAAVAVSHLLWSYEHMPKKFTRTVNIPESNNGCPDILNEARYEIHWMLKMQREDGGVYHKVTTASHARFVMPEEDHGELFVLPVSSMATAMFAASIAQAAHVFLPYDAPFAHTLYMAACRSYHWLMENPEFLPFWNPADCHTGGYGHRSDKDHRLWAAVELLRATEAMQTAGLFAAEESEAFAMLAHCEASITQLINDPSVNKTSFGWMETGALAMLGIIYGSTQPVLAAHRVFAVSVLLTEATATLALTKSNAFQIPMLPSNFFWGSNMLLMCRGMLFLFAYDLTKDIRYTDAAHACLDYLLGKNCLEFSYVSGHGYHSLKRPHNRPTVAASTKEMIPGFVAGGANAGYLDEAAAQHFGKEKPAPMACHWDNWLCYSLNEIAIYWNTPALFVSAFFS